MGLPISWLFMNSVKHFVIAFDGTIWPSRLIGFTIGMIVFTIMAQILFSEGLSLKTISCLALSILILIIVRILDDGEQGHFHYKLCADCILARLLDLQIVAEQAGDTDV